MEPHRKKLRRYEHKGHARFLTFSCYQRHQFLAHPDARDLVADQIHRARTTLSFRLFAWVVMPEHVHLLLLPAQETTVSRILAAIKRPSAFHMLERWRSSNNPSLRLATTPSGTPRFWQAGGGYDRNIFSDNELSEKMRYIDENPVRRGLAPNPEAWPWSSARALRRLESNWPDIDSAHGG
ncbi:MAG: transposase [Phycisphaerales bacterium]|nr:transposase [Planctomycetota bacterium]MCH8509411.1 transposase [Phycisphaerales bacterium]